MSLHWYLHRENSFIQRVCHLLSVFKKSDIRVFPLTSCSIMMVAKEWKLYVTKEIFGRKAVEEIELNEEYCAPGQHISF